MRKIFIFLICLLTLLVINNLFVFAEEKRMCNGEICYTDKDSILFKFEEVIIDIILHNDESISYSQTIGMSYQSNLSFDKTAVFFREFSLPQESIIGTDIEVKELISDIKFKEVYFFDIDCDGKFTFSRTENLVTLCFRPQKQQKFNIKTIILSNKNMSKYYQLSGGVNNILFNSLEQAFEPTNNSYFMSFSFIGDEDVLVENVFDRGCPGSGEQKDNLSNVIAIPKKNGMLCQGFIFPTEKIIIQNMNLVGKNQALIELENQNEREKTQKEYIEAATNSANLTKWTVRLTALLVLVTIVSYLINKKVVDEMKISRRYQFKPAFKINIIKSVTGRFSVEIINIGVGSAKNINGKISLIPSGEIINFNRNLLYSKEKFVLRSPLNYIKTVQDFEKFKKLSLRVTYEDILNNHYKEIDNFSVVDLTNIKYGNLSKNEKIYELRTISSKLESIEQAISNIKNK